MAPAWSYQLGLEHGWIPADPRGAAGACGNANPRSSTGLPSASGIPASATASLGWPPASISGAGAPSTLPAYTPTGPLITLPGPTFAAPSGQPAPTATPQVGSGWNNAGDSAGMMVPVPTCSYLDPWIGSTAAVPSPLCGGAAPTSAGSRRTARAYPAAITPAPRA
jgi:glucan 1,3-beta-glucosidase